jgi:hypothetical protein
MSHTQTAGSGTRHTVSIRMPNPAT